MKNLLFGLFLLLATATFGQKKYEAIVVSNTAAVKNNYEGFRVLLKNENGGFSQGIWNAKYVFIEVKGEDESGPYQAYAAINENLLVGDNPIKTGDKVTLLKYPKKVAITTVPGPIIVCLITSKCM